MPDPKLLVLSARDVRELLPFGECADLVAGVHLYNLLGFVYFDATNSLGEDFSLSSPAALAAFGKGASAFTRPTS